MLGRTQQRAFWPFVLAVLENNLVRTEAAEQLISQLIDVELGGLGLAHRIVMLPTHHSRVLAQQFVGGQLFNAHDTLSKGRCIFWDTRLEWRVNSKLE